MMKKRRFIKLAGATIAGTMVSPFISCTTRKDKGTEEIQTITGFTLPELPYEYPALEPHIDARTMEIHYSRHHAGYVDNLNTALEKSSFKSKSLESILNEIVPGETAIRNNGGGHYNHTLFWNIMDPKGGGDPEGEVAGGIERDLGSIDQFRESFSDVAASVFGSGWAWLCKDGENRLFITSTPNQDNPLMTKIVGKTGIPILGIDVWEHAYYLKYQNRRAEYISSFFNVINWQEVNRRYLEDL